MTFLRKISKNSKGATAIEYGLIAALIAVAAIAAMQGLGTSLQTTFNNVSSGMNSQGHPQCDAGKEAAGTFPPPLLVAAASRVSRRFRGPRIKCLATSLAYAQRQSTHEPSAGGQEVWTSARNVEPRRPEMFIRKL